MKTEKQIQGKKNRQSGSAFERKVRGDLENEGWVVIKNPNNVIDGKFKQGKPKYNPFTKSLMMHTGGFPDFIAIKQSGSGSENYILWCIECKSNGYLSKIEKEKVKWLLDNFIFSKIYVASKGVKRGEIIYNEFK